MLRKIDLPPVWLLGFLVLAWLQSRYYTVGFSFGGSWADFLGGLLVGGGIVVAALAIFEFRRAKTTLIPHRDADRMVTTGIYHRSRNPIYLADTMILAGLILYWDAVLALPLIPIFLWILEKRFVIPEENRLRRKFRTDFARYCQRTRRWL